VNAEQTIIRRAALDEILPLRHQILRAGLPMEAARFPGDDAASNIHLGAFTHEGKCVGCATLHLNEFEQQPAYQLRGMAVDTALQRHGIGSRLLLEIESLATSSRILWCNARTPAVAFYRKHGWTMVSDEFLIPTAGPHFKMVKQLQHVQQSS
jgi:N-acetylglutamate synthase-like GNAT family acetyltransferase